MSFSEDIKKPFNIITLTIAIISIGLTIYFYVEGIKEKSICYKIEHNPSLIFDNLSSTYKCNFLGADNKQ